jgi:DNA replicative helicase MCM subunit Mcm2 (Cdc46/Mcm family)
MQAKGRCISKEAARIPGRKVEAEKTWQRDKGQGAKNSAQQLLRRPRIRGISILRFKGSGACNSIYGRYTLRSMQDIAQRHRFGIIAGDTDSLFLRQENKDNEHDDKKAKKYDTYLITKAIQLQQRKKRTLTVEDIHAIKRFAGLEPIWDSKGCIMRSTLKSRLISMFAPNIISDANKKLAQLLAATGAPEDEYHRGRINELMIGPPGTGKTKLAKEAMKLRLNSRFISGKNTTGLSLTAMILKENENYVVHLGPVPLSKYALCIINEFDKLEPGQQDNLLDVMEEGLIPLNKFARLKNIKSPTSIIATANPRNNHWVDPNRIDSDEIPIELTKLSRFDIWLVFRDKEGVEENRRFANKKSEYDRKKIKHNYNFLQKYIEYVRTLQPEILPEADSMFNEYFARRKAEGHPLATNRLLETLQRIAKALARLYLRDKVDVELAGEVIDFVNYMLDEFSGASYRIADPRSLAYDETVAVIRQQSVPIDLTEAIRMACQKHKQIAYYLGAPLDQSRNKKVRSLCNKILENRSIARVKVKPLVIRWAGDKSRNDGQSGLPEKCAAQPTPASAATQAHGAVSNSEGGGNTQHAELRSYESDRSQVRIIEKRRAIT